jgi:hypothetical protein
VESSSEPLAEVVVRASSRAHLLRESAQAVKVVETARAHPHGADLGELLARTEGVGVQRSGGLGSDTRLSLHGLTDDPIRVFLDGVPLEFSGFGLRVASVPVNWIERVEVYRGVVPVRFGADAPGGALDRRAAAQVRADVGGLVCILTGNWVWLERSSSRWTWRSLRSGSSRWLVRRRLAASSGAGWHVASRVQGASVRRTARRGGPSMTELLVLDLLSLASVLIYGAGSERGHPRFSWLRRPRRAPAAHLRALLLSVLALAYWAQTEPGPAPYLVVAVWSHGALDESAIGASHGAGAVRGMAHECDDGAAL